MSIRQDGRNAVLCAGVVMGLASLLTTSAVIAQEDGAAAAELDRVQVTGSRIRRATLEGDSPVLTLSREDLERTGQNSIADILQQLTTGGSALNTRLNSSGNFGFPPNGGGVGAGSAQVDLRHLGSQRVLVLVDGLRWVNETSASGISSAVDLNTIPLAIVDRIEILEDGASSIYGSDAIGGVVNVITRKDFQGGEATAYYGQWDEGDGDTVRGEISFGGSADKLSYFFSLGYNNQDEISSDDRELSRFPTPGTGVTRGSSATPLGRFIFNDPTTGEGFDLTLNNPVGGRPVFNPGGDDDFKSFTNDDRFNFSPFNLLLTPSERFSIFGQVNYAISDHVNFYARALFNERESVNQAAPEPIFLGPEAGTGGLADTVSIDVSNPFNPFGFTLDATSNFALLGRRPIEGGPRIFEQDVDTRYLAAGFQGDFYLGNKAFFWDVNFVDSKNEAEQVTFGSYNIRRIATALGPVDVCNNTPGCVPLNLFGGLGSITQDMLDYISFTGIDTSEQELRSITANISGDLIELPAGMLAFAAGYEHRDLDGQFQPDSVIVAGESNGVPALPSAGGYEVDEFYAELIVPVLSDVPLVRQFDITAAIRFSDYSTFGNETTPKLGFRWQISDDLLLRGTYAEGLRAPGIGELFGTASRFDATLADPCSDFLNSGASQQVINNCIALGVPADGSFEQPNPQISVVTGGNENLEPETSDSYTAGLVYSPSWAENLSWASRLDFEFTYYRHELDGAIQALDAQTQLSACVRTLNPLFCDGIDRAFTGGINNFQNRLTNIGGIETDGFDFKLFYSSPEMSWGRIDINWQTTHVLGFDELLLDPNNPDGFISRQLEGIEENDSAIPEWQSNLIVSWNSGPWNASWTVRYIDSVSELCSDFRDGSDISLTNLGLCSDPNFDDNTQSRNTLDSRFYNDVQLGYTAQLSGYELNLTAGVNNLFDEDPPLCFSCSLNGFDVTTHDLPGQFWYLRTTLRF
ncbi:MAG: TonB-dependent receptor [Wenzhouxiangellaceae bacterium]